MAKFNIDSVAVIDYIRRAEDIAKWEFMTLGDLCLNLGIAPGTLIRLRKFPDKCAMITAKKLKNFVEEWEKNNLSHVH